MAHWQYGGPANSYRNSKHQQDQLTQDGVDSPIWHPVDGMHRPISTSLLFRSTDVLNRTLMQMATKMADRGPGNINNNFGGSLYCPTSSDTIQQWIILVHSKRPVSRSKLYFCPGLVLDVSPDVLNNYWNWGTISWKSSLSWTLKNSYRIVYIFFALLKSGSLEGHKLETDKWTEKMHHLEKWKS